MLKTPIPYVDLRGKSLIDLLRAYPDRAHLLINAARHTYGKISHMASKLALPVADKKSHAWLKRTSNPYLYEIESFADILRVPGVYALNLSYEWGCTGTVCPTDETVSLLRVLDWPFPELGKQVMVIRQQAKPGDFYNITWPGVSGVFTGMAPGRFSATLNQAPMRMHKLTVAGDWLKNRRLMKHELGLPPAHLLRQVFEQATSYENAKQMLSTASLAMPVIFILAGTRAGQGCIIERLENDVAITELGARQQVSASNHFVTRLNTTGKGWRPREINSEGRLRQSASIHGHDLAAEHFNWLQGPMVNPFTRLAVVCDAARERLMVQGFEGMARTTELFNLQGSKQDGREIL